MGCTNPNCATVHPLKSVCGCCGGPNPNTFSFCDDCSQDKLACCIKARAALAKPDPAFERKSVVWCRSYMMADFGARGLDPARVRIRSDESAQIWEVQVEGMFAGEPEVRDYLARHGWALLIVKDRATIAAEAKSEAFRRSRGWTRHYP